MDVLVSSLVIIIVYRVSRKAFAQFNTLLQTYYSFTKINSFFRAQLSFIIVIETSY